MESELPIRLLLIDPPAGLDYGIQRGAGTDYQTLFVQQVKLGQIIFDFSITVTESQKDGSPNFKGPFVQGPPAGRFIYIDVGTYAGQRRAECSGRMKIPLHGITWELIKQTISKPNHGLLARLPGRAKNGGPALATVKLLGDWEVVPTVKAT